MFGSRFVRRNRGDLSKPLAWWLVKISPAFLVTLVTALAQQHSSGSPTIICRKSKNRGVRFEFHFWHSWLVSWQWVHPYGVCRRGVATTQWRSVQHCIFVYFMRYRNSPVLFCRVGLNKRLRRKHWYTPTFISQVQTCADFVSKSRV